MFGRVAKFPNSGAFNAMAEMDFRTRGGGGGPQLLRNYKIRSRDFTQSLFIYPGEGASDVGNGSRRTDSAMGGYFQNARNFQAGEESRFPITICKVPFPVLIVILRRRRLLQDIIQVLGAMRAEMPIFA